MSCRSETRYVATADKLGGNAVALQAANSSTDSRYEAQSKSVTLDSAVAGVVGSQITHIGDLANQAVNTPNSRLAAASASKPATTPTSSAQ